MHRNTITAADNDTAIITKANKGTKVKVGITEDRDKVVVTTGTITNIKAKVMEAMAITTNMVITIMVAISTMVMAINTVEGTTRTEDMATADTTGPTDPTVITDLMHMDMDHMLITHSHTIHMSHSHST